MKVKQSLIEQSKYGIKCPYAMTAEFIVVHNTANDAPAGNEVAYMKRNNYEVSFHYAVDDKEIIQGIPENRNAWHSGDGNGDGNRKGIAVEICYSLNGGEQFEKAEKNAAEFIAEKLKEKNWDISKVKKHQDFDGKYCPHRTLDLGWNRFIKMIESYMPKAEKPTEEVKSETYVVENGDTLGEIASKFGTTVEKLAEINAIKNVNLIYPGQELQLDKKITVHIVKSGDTLYDISEKYSVDLNHLAKINGLSNPSLIHPGQKILIE